MIGTAAIKGKRGIQWDRSQISVPKGPLDLLLTPMELYFGLKNTAMTNA